MLDKHIFLFLTTYYFFQMCFETRPMWSQSLWTWNHVHGQQTRKPNLQMFERSSAQTWHYYWMWSRVYCKFCIQCSWSKQSISCYFIPFYTIFLQIDPDCKTGYICKNQKCVERPDPCNPNPCGPNAICEPVGLTGQFTCKCPSGFIGNPKVSCTKVSYLFSVANFFCEILKYFCL